MNCSCFKTTDCKVRCISAVLFILVLIILIFGIGYQLGSLKASKFYEEMLNNILPYGAADGIK